VPAKYGGRESTVKGKKKLYIKIRLYIQKSEITDNVEKMMEQDLLSNTVKRLYFADSKRLKYIQSSIREESHKSEKIGCNYR